MCIYSTHMVHRSWPFPRSYCWCCENIWTRSLTASLKWIDCQSRNELFLILHRVCNWADRNVFLSHVLGATWVSHISVVETTVFSAMQSHYDKPPLSTRQQTVRRTSCTHRALLCLFTFLWRSHMAMWIYTHTQCEQWFSATLSLSLCLSWLHLLLPHT